MGVQTDFLFNKFTMSSKLNFNRLPRLAGMPVFLFDDKAAAHRLTVDLYVYLYSDKMSLVCCGASY